MLRICQVKPPTLLSVFPSLSDSYGWIWTYLCGETGHRTRNKRLNFIGNPDTCLGLNQNLIIFVMFHKQSVKQVSFQFIHNFLKQLAKSKNKETDNQIARQPASQTDRKPTNQTLETAYSSPTLLAEVMNSSHFFTLRSVAESVRYTSKEGLGMRRSYELNRLKMK